MDNNEAQAGVGTLHQLVGGPGFRFRRNWVSLCHYCGTRWIQSAMSKNTKKECAWLVARMKFRALLEMHKYGWRPGVSWARKRLEICDRHLRAIRASNPRVDVAADEQTKKEQ